MKSSALSMDNLRAAVQRLPANALTPLRETAVANLGKSGLPSLRHEDWKYTDLAAAIEISNRWLEAGANTPAADAAAQSIETLTASIDANWLIVANGALNLSRFGETAAIDVERFSASAAPTITERPLENLNAALLLDGLRVQIHAATEKPLGILIIDDAGEAAIVSQANIQIEVAPGCDAEIIEYQCSSGANDCYGNTVITLQTGQGSHTRYVRIQDRSLRHVQTGSLDISLGRDSQLQMASYDLGGGLVRNDVNIGIDEPGTEAVFDGLYLAGDGQHIDNHTRVDHRVGPARSAQEYRGILNGRCRCVWNGKAIVHAGADGTDANQSNHNLLLSEKAEIDAKPELEIYADDVKCSHGTTVGQLDETALFYLRSRGLDQQTATQVLTHAFAADLVNRVPIAATHAVVLPLVEAKLADILQESPS